jgi:hypothetical protein
VTVFQILNIDYSCKIAKLHVTLQAYHAGEDDKKQRKSRHREAASRYENNVSLLVLMILMEGVSG